MEQSTLCKSCFKNSERSAIVQAYTNLWIRLIHQAERSKAALSGSVESV